MRKVLLALSGLLAATGLWLVFTATSGFQDSQSRMASLAHILLGVFFIIVFPLYSSEHIKKHSNWLKRLKWMTLSGSLQAVAGLVLILSGLVLLMYGRYTWPWMRDTHHLLTYLLAGALAVHFLAPKKL